MAKRPLVEFILKVINLVFAVWGLGTLGYGLVCFLRWKQSLSKEIHESNAKYMIVHRLLLAIDHSSDPLPRAWFIYFMIGIGAILFIISCLGYIGTSSRSPCCLLSYCVFLVALITVEIGVAAFTFFKHDWKEVVPEDRSGRFYTIYNFLSANWKVIKWVLLAVFILQVIAMVLSLYLRSEFKRAWYDRINDIERTIHLPRVRMVSPIRGTPSTTINANNRDPPNTTISQN